MSCPWAKIEKPEPVNLSEIMSEEVAKDLQAKENKRYEDSLIATAVETIPEEVFSELATSDYQSDAEIARMLQMQYDKEHDEILKRTENKYNGASKVSVSFNNFRRVPVSDDFQSDSEEEEMEDIIDRKDWDRFDTLQREINSIPPCGYKLNQDGTVTTKHDITMNGRKNACKILSFPPEFQTGDGENFDMKLSNKVFNSLKIYSRNEQTRKHRIQDKKEDQATASFGLDEFTSLILYKMVNNQLLERINGIISIGKESVILHAICDPNYTEAELPKECVIKVFKTTLSEFKQRDKYIKDDHRFRDRIGKQTSKNTVHLWAEKEMANLYRLARVGIPCPAVIKHKKHCLVMSFIGENHMPAPKLKEAVMTDADYIVAYDEVVEAMKTLYSEANLIHGDLSEYNILWHQNKCYFIDVSQSVEPRHENAFQFLMRDCTNITNFFSRRGVPEVMPPGNLFQSITGFDFDDKVALLALQKSFKIKPHLVDTPGFEPECNFETTWQKIINDVKTEEQVQNFPEKPDDVLLIEPPVA